MFSPNNAIDLQKPFLLMKPEHYSFITGHSKNLGELPSLRLKLIVISSFTLISLGTFGLLLISRPCAQCDSGYPELMDSNLAQFVLVVIMIGGIGLTGGAVGQLISRILRVKKLESSGTSVLGHISRLLSVKYDTNSSALKTERQYEVRFNTTSDRELQTTIRLPDVPPEDIDEMIGLPVIILYVNPKLFEVL